MRQCHRTECKPVTRTALHIIAVSIWTADQKRQFTRSIIPIARDQISKHLTAQLSTIFIERNDDTAC